MRQTFDQHWLNQRYIEAKAIGEQALEESIQALGERHEETLLLMLKLGTVYLNHQDHKRAEALLSRVYALRMEIDGDNKPATIEVAHNLAAAMHDMDELERALPLQRKVLAFLSATKDKAAPERLAALGNLADTSRKLGYLGDALRLNKESFELSQAADGEKALSTLSAMNNLAVTLLDMGRWSEALALQTAHIDLITQVAGPQHPNTITSLNNLAGTYKQLGRDKEALALFKKSLDLSAQVHGQNHSKTIEAMNNLASTQMDMGYPKEAAALLDEALGKARSLLGERNDTTLKISANLGNALVKAGRVDLALLYQQAAVTTSESVLGETHRDTLIAKNNLAETLRLLGRLDEALRLGSDVLQIQAANMMGEFHPDTLVTLNNLALTNNALGRSSESIRLYRQMMQGVEKLRSAGDLAAENRRALFAQWVDGYKALSMLYIAEKRYQEAFAVTELSKARTLLESLTQKHADRSGVLDEADRDKLSQYESQISRLDDAIAHSNRDIDQWRLKREKDDVRRTLYTYRKSLEQRHPKYAKLNAVTQLNIASGRKYIPADAAFISYVLSGSRLGAFVLTRHGKLRAVDLGDVKGIERSLETYRRILGSKESLSKLHSEGNTVWGLPDGSYEIATEKPDQAAKRVTEIDEILKVLANRLANRLIKPLERFIAHKRHWIISPDGALALVPFEALPWAGRLVVERHDVSYVQSLSVLGLIQQRAREYAVKTSRKQLFAMGDPIYGPLAQANTTLLGDAPTGAAGARGLPGVTWPQLPGTGKELGYAAHTFDKSSTVLMRDEATEAKLLALNRSRKLAEYRYLLFSAHGYLNSDNPALSALVLGQTSLQEGTDGYVTASEWPAYDLQSDLIVLSACETGLGRVVSGEGVLGLPYALYVAGNRNTLLSLWNIDDDSTAEFIKDLFARLKAGVPQVRAVAETKRQFIKRNRGQYANPIFWAPFVLYGV